MFENLTCSCTTAVFMHKEDYDLHLEERGVWCKCGEEFKSQHEWNTHKCGKAVEAFKPELVEYIRTIADIQLKTQNTIIAILKVDIPVEILKGVDKSYDYTITDGRLVVEHARTHRKPRTNKTVKEAKTPRPEKNREDEVYARFGIFP